MTEYSGQTGGAMIYVTGSGQWAGCLRFQLEYITPVDWGSSEPLGPMDGASQF